MGVNFKNKYQNLVVSIGGKSHIKIVKWEVGNFEHLCSNTRAN